MLEERPEIEIDFEGEMKARANQAGAKNAPAANGTARIDRAELTQVIGNLIRPLAEELEALKRGPMHEHSVMLAALGKAINAQHAAPQAPDALAREFKRLESIETEIRRLGSVESANSKLFDALHAELKTYKDNFLFDSLQRPYIRDLVSLFDDLSDLHAQTERRLEEHPAEDGEDAAFLRTLAGNLENQIAHMVEVFLRMDVVLSRTPVGAPLDKKTHRTVSFEPAARAVRFSGWTLEPSRRRLLNPDGVEVALTGGEYDLLVALVERANRVLTRDMLLDLLRGRQAGPFDRAIDVAISRLRRKLEDDGRHAQLIKTVRGGGYVLAADIERS